MIRSLSNWGVFSLPRALGSRRGATAAASDPTTVSSPSGADAGATTDSSNPTPEEVYGALYQDPNTTIRGSYTRGHYFKVRFDAASKVQTELRRQLGLDPRVLRIATVRLAGGSRTTGGGGGPSGAGGRVRAQKALEGLARYGGSGGREEWMGTRG